MSVMTFGCKEFQRVASSIIETPSLKEFTIDLLEDNQFFNDYIDNQKKMRFSGEPERNVASLQSVFIWKLFKMAWVGNETCYAFQYKESADFSELKDYDKCDTLDFSEKTGGEGFLTGEQIASQIGSFIYNVYANNGEVLMSPDYFECFEILYTAYKKNFPEQEVEIPSYYID